MTTRQHDQAKQRKGRSRRPQTLAAHPAFAPMLGVWGAALAGLSIMVLPSAMIIAASKGTGLAQLGPQAQIALASFAALLLGGGLFILAARMNRAACRRTGTPSLTSMATRHDVRPIDPARELGSVSLDEPVVAMPFAATAEPEPAAAEALMPPPRELDLSEFGELPGRNGVWVAAEAEETGEPGEPLADPSPSPPVDPVVPAAAAPTPAVPAAANPSAAALNHLRALPTEELSIVQMVERFAGALHEHRASTVGSTVGSTGANRHDIAARDAALAEALKALTALSGGTDAKPAQGEPLRAALARLQGLRGAA